LRTRIGSIAVEAARSVQYEGAGTVEFLFSEGQFYFLEVNARIQVEHPATEMAIGIDIVQEQIRIASGLPLGIRQEEIAIRGSAIECRINAEDPFNDFIPSPGKITRHLEPGGPGIRIDSGVCDSSTIPPFYDSLISKLVAWGRDRNEAIARMRRALYEYAIDGVKTNIPFHRAVMENENFVKGNLGTQFMDTETSLIDDMKRIAEQKPLLQGKLPQHLQEKKKIAAVAAAVFMSSQESGSG
jgi:pyruvate carboxylase subunit A